MVTEEIILVQPGHKTKDWVKPLAVHLSFI